METVREALASSDLWDRALLVWKPPPRAPGEGSHPPAKGEALPSQEVGQRCKLWHSLCLLDHSFGTGTSSTFHGPIFLEEPQGSLNASFIQDLTNAREPNPLPSNPLVDAPE